MAPTYKLQYFNVTGLGEPIRYIFAYGKIPFEDARFEYAEFEQIKPTTPFGKVPVVEVDGKKIHQSAAICRYLGKQIGLAGKSDWDQLQADMVIDTLTDFRLNYTGWFHAKDETEKAQKFEEIKTVHNPYYLSRFEEQVATNGGYFVNGQLTWADIYFVALTEMLDKRINDSTLFDKYPKLKELKLKVENLPGIKEYRSSRPKSD